MNIAKVFLFYGIHNYLKKITLILPPDYTQGNYKKAEPLCLRSLAIFEKVFGKQHPNTKTVKENLRLLQLEWNK
jgi:hypothetical protein